MNYKKQISYFQKIQVAPKRYFCRFWIFFKIFDESQVDAAWDKIMYRFIFKKNFFKSFISKFNKLNKVSFRFGLYHYLYWLKIGCKNILWKHWFFFNFLIDVIFNSFNPTNFNFSKITCGFIKSTTAALTLSKGILVRKKQSREQYTFKQDFLKISLYWKFFNLTQFFRNFRIIKIYYYLRKKFVPRPNINSLFLVRYFNIKKNMPLFETSLFFLKNIYFFTSTFIDWFFFFARKTVFVYKKPDSKEPPHIVDKESPIYKRNLLKRSIESCVFNRLYFPSSLKKIKPLRLWKKRPKRVRFKSRWRFYRAYWWGSVPFFFIKYFMY